MRKAYAVVAAFLTFPVCLAHIQWNLARNIRGRSFLKTFTWETLDDPTHGRVNYVNLGRALKTNLTFASDNKFIMAADSKRVVQPGDRGRDSVRIISNEAWDEFLVVLDLQHMPEGCATWPAFWTLSRAGPWPNGGEIDIIEGVNLNTLNLASLHTTSNCMMPEQRMQTGMATGTNCDAAANFNQGCGTAFTAAPESFGAPFNAAGGGWYVMRRTRDHGISVWFWSRDDQTVPFEVQDGTLPLIPEMFGTPDADFPTDPFQCSYDEHFNDHRIVFDLTFCGDWAGNVYSSSGCPGTCTDYVDNNPSAFSQAFWEINALRIYLPS